jgi:hypothetical protein
MFLDRSALDLKTEGLLVLEVIGLNFDPWPESINHLPTLSEGSVWQRNMT